MILHPEAFKTKNTTPTAITLTIHLVKIPQGADGTYLRNQTTPSRYTIWFQWFLGFTHPPTWTTFLMARELESNLFCANTIITFGGRFENGG